MNTLPTPAPAVERIALTEHELAPELRVSVSWLQHDRRGLALIPFYRIGGNIRYNLVRVREALAALEEGGAPKRRRAGA